jgi:hypothetical protein
MYGSTIWLLVHDGPSAASGQTPGYHLRLDGHFSTLIGAAGAPLHLLREAELRRAVEPLFAAADAGEADAAEALLDSAGSEIDRVLGRR